MEFEAKGTLVLNGISYSGGASGGEGGTSDYSELTNKPKLNDVELNGDMTLEDLGIQFKADAQHRLNGLYVAYTKDQSVTSKLNELNATVGQVNDLLEGV